MRKCHNHKSTTSQSQHEETESIIRNTDFVASTRAPDKRQRAVKRDMLLAYDQWLELQGSVHSRIVDGLE